MRELRPPLEIDHECELPEAIWPEGSLGCIYARCARPDCGLEYQLIKKINGPEWVLRAEWKARCAEMKGEPKFPMHERDVQPMLDHLIAQHEREERAHRSLPPLNLPPGLSGGYFEERDGA